MRSLQPCTSCVRTLLTAHSAKEISRSLSSVYVPDGLGDENAPKRADRRLQRALFRRYYYQKLSGAATDHPAQDGMARRRYARRGAAPGGQQCSKQRLRRPFSNVAGAGT